MKYGESKSIKDYDLTPGVWDRNGIGMLITKIEFWAFQYDFSFQFWGPGQNNVFINRDDVEVNSSGGFDTIKEVFQYVLEWCEKANPRVKYPEAIIGIETKKMPNGKWSCFATFDGYDHAFVTDSKEESQQQMREQLKKRDLEGHGLFMAEVQHPPMPQGNKADKSWRPGKIDNNPFA